MRVVLCNLEPYDVYMETFQWNTMKYRSDKTLRELMDTIVAEVVQADTLIKGKASTYTAVRTQLQGIQRKQTYLFITQG